MKKKYVSAKEFFNKLESDPILKPLIKKERKKTMKTKIAKPEVKRLSILDKLKIKLYDFIDLFKLVQ